MTFLIAFGGIKPKIDFWLKKLLLYSTNLTTDHVVTYYTPSSTAGESQSRQIVLLILPQLAV